MKLGKTVDEIEETKVVREEFERYVSLLSEDGACKIHDIGFQQHSNEMLREELHKLQKVVEKLKTRENNLASELQMATEKLSHYNKDSVKLLDELHAASIMELIFKEKLIEIMQIFNSIDIVEFKMPTEEVALRKVLEDYKGKFVSLERENKKLKAELNAYVPLVASLESEMASLEEKTLALTNLHILNSKRKQGNLLSSLKRKKSIQMRGQHNSPRASAGIIELKKLRGKVKVLQKAVADTERHLDEERVHSDANVNLSTTKSKARVTSRSTRSAQAQKDIILDLRNDVDTGNNSDDNVLLKDDGMLSRVKHEQMKDIELDHVLSSCGLEPSFSVEKDHLAIEVWKPGTETDLWYDNISKMDVERSEKPSDELVLLKETSVDNLAYPACCTESHQAWIKWVNCSVSADARRLVALQNCLKELKISIQTSDTKCQLSISELKCHQDRSERG
ncbi:hypothetical protein HPP92_012117 [Vanilla planifolia]|uniref:Uncharacterized protein n=1 Tax=Vanilla planifolia TaxID=51239 RepID=A0A835R350_VANPL|nr:hypothetical protein HPP92_012117 [Vanilla planifolia]